jgi:nucleotide-binding universal stress UspA family protein
MEASIKKIILATDFSDISKDASSHALLLAKTYNVELKVLHGWPSTSFWVAGYS